MELKHSLSRVPSILYLWSQAHLLTTSKEEDILHPLGNLLLKIGADFTTHGFLFKAETYQFIECSTHGSNPQALFLSYQLISVALHGSNFHPQSMFLIHLSTFFFFQRGIFLQTYSFSLDLEVHMHSLRMLLHRRTKNFLIYCLV